MTKSISGSLIRAKRIKLRLTLTEFAKLAGCNERTVRRVESGDSHYLYATSTFARILESLELSSREKKVFGTFLTIAGKFSQIDRKKMFGFSSCLGSFLVLMQSYDAMRPILSIPSEFLT